MLAKRVCVDVRLLQLDGAARGGFLLPRHAAAAVAAAVAAAAAAEVFRPHDGREPTKEWLAPSLLIIPLNTLTAPAALTTSARVVIIRRRSDRSADTGREKRGHKFPSLFKLQIGRWTTKRVHTHSCR